MHPLSKIISKSSKKESPSESNAAPKGWRAVGDILGDIMKDVPFC
jgi:hypothetical protein